MIQTTTFSQSIDETRSVTSFNLKSAAYNIRRTIIIKWLCLAYAVRGGVIWYMSHSVDNDFRDSGGINNAQLHSKHRKFGKINIHSSQRILHNSLLWCSSDENSYQCGLGAKIAECGFMLTRRTGKGLTLQERYVALSVCYIMLRFIHSKNMLHGNIIHPVTKYICNYTLVA